jgi:phosphoribosylanthranilate isomerase
MFVIKICGLTRLDDALAAIQLGADYLGFVFYPDSLRAITSAQAAAIMACLPACTRAIGVFVNAPRADILRTTAACGLHAVQLHGDERPEEYADMPLPVWRAVRLLDGRIEPEPAAWPAATILLDAAPPGQYCGAGMCTDWKAAARLARTTPMMLAGGLTADNVAEAIRQVHPAGVDVSSGIEASPGRKNVDQMRRFIEAARRET